MSILRQTHKFSVTETLLVIAMVGLTIRIAVPIYDDYTLTAHTVTIARDFNHEVVTVADGETIHDKGLAVVPVGYATAHNVKEFGATIQQSSMMRGKNAACVAITLPDGKIGDGVRKILSKQFRGITAFTGKWTAATAEITKKGFVYYVAGSKC